MTYHRLITTGALSLLLTTTASAQTAAPTTLPDPSSLRSTLTAETLADLPLGNNLYTALETMQPELIADRFNNSGLNVGEGARVGGFLASWSQTYFRIGDVNISDPVGSGAALLFPEALFWRRVDITMGLMPISLQTAGLATTLEPQRPTTRWTTVASVAGSGGSLAAPTPSGPVPPVARLRDYANGSVLVSGPISPDRLGIVAGATLSQASKLIREFPVNADSDLASGFVNLVYTPSAQSEWRTLGWLQHATVPFEYRRVFPAESSTEDTSLHVQSTWERRLNPEASWRIFGGVTQRSRGNDSGDVSSITVDRLLDGPTPWIVSATGESTSRRWTFGGRLGASAARGSLHHLTAIGLDVDLAQATSRNQFTGAIGELVDNVPARLWTYSHPAAEANRHATTVSAFASDHITFSPTLTLDVGARLEWTGGSADGAATGISWVSLLPSALMHWQFAARPRLSLVTGYRRSGNALNLDLLAFGDPAAPTATVSRWSSGPASSPVVGPVIDRVGPGTGGDETFSRIDPDLQRSHTDEFVVGLESHPREWMRLNLTGVARRQGSLLGVVDVGVPIDGYSTVGVPDPGLDFLSDHDDQILLFYNRLPSSFARNQYLLTNPGQDAATSYALKLTAEGSTDRLFLLFGATAYLASASASSRGYQPIENDQDIPGEVFTNPNAATYARGRLFSDRAFTIKWTTVYRFPADFRVGAIARYQDGQPSARLVISPALNQGPEAVRAFPNGRNRFTFTGSLDLRLQKGFNVGGTRLDAMLDIYNLATRSNEVDEYVVSGPAFRTPTAIEPQRSVHLGLRATF